MSGCDESCEGASRELASLRVDRLDRQLAQGGSMGVNWGNDADAAIAEAKRSGKLVLLDFTAAPH
jgi:hypothetical protein